MLCRCAPQIHLVIQTESILTITAQKDNSDLELGATLSNDIGDIRKDCSGLQVNPCRPLAFPLTDCSKIPHIILYEGLCVALVVYVYQLRVSNNKLIHLILLAKAHDVCLELEPVLTKSLFHSSLELCCAWEWPNRPEMSPPSPTKCSLPAGS